MMELLTAAQMRSIEAAAIASGQVTGLELMERAGRGVVDAIFAEWPELAAGTFRAVVLCGPGNNGGDGFVVARLLREWGWEVAVFLYGDAGKLPPDARVNYARWLGMGTLQPIEAWPDYPGAEPDILIDALFGTGLARPMEDPVAGFAHVMFDGRINTRFVAVDGPSGLCLDSGRILGVDVPYFGELTVTFQRPKTGHYLGCADAYHSYLQPPSLRVVDIGLDGWIQRRFAGDPAEAVRLNQGPVAKLGRSVGGHKYTYGHALMLAGPSGRGGAARLAARGALRIGAGVVTVGCPLDAIPEHAARLDAVMLRGVADGAGLAEVLADKRINALCLGPGMGVDVRGRALVAAALGLVAGGPPPPSPPHGGEGGRVGQGATPEDQTLPLAHVGWGKGWGARSVVLDADALTILAHHPDLYAALHDGCVLTPHAGEFARLFPDIAAKLAAPATTGPAYSKVDATREAARRAGCVVLFKGPDTVIADPSGRCVINSAHDERAAPWLATAGSGDVLAGFVTGLLARGFTPFEAACTAAWLHVECARSFGPGLIAEDLPEQLPKVFRALGL